MKLSRTLSYAWQAVVRLADTFEQDPVPCSRLAADGKMSNRFLLQILRDLVAHQILNSTRGVVGGYTLARPPEKISVLDIVEAIDGPITGSLPMAGEFPRKTRVRLERLLKDVQVTVRSQLAALTVADLRESS